MVGGVVGGVVVGVGVGVGGVGPVDGVVIGAFGGAVGGDVGKVVGGIIVGSIDRHFVGVVVGVGVVDAGYLCCRWWGCCWKFLEIVLLGVLRSWKWWYVVVDIVGTGVGNFNRDCLGVVVVIFVGAGSGGGGGIISDVVVGVFVVIFVGTFVGAVVGVSVGIVVAVGAVVGDVCVGGLVAGHSSGGFVGAVVSVAIDTFIRGDGGYFVKTVVGNFVGEFIGTIIGNVQTLCTSFFERRKCTSFYHMQKKTSFLYSCLADKKQNIENVQSHKFFRTKKMYKVLSNAYKKVFYSFCAWAYWKKKQQLLWKILEKKHFFPHKKNYSKLPPLRTVGDSV